MTFLQPPFPFWNPTEQLFPPPQFLIGILFFTRSRPSGVGAPSPRLIKRERIYQSPQIWLERLIRVSLATQSTAQSTAPCGLRTWVVWSWNIFYLLCSAVFYTLSLRLKSFTYLRLEVIYRWNIYYSNLLRREREESSYGLSFIKIRKGEMGYRPNKPVRRPPVQIPESNNKALIEEHKLTLIGRVMNPWIQKTKALVDFFLQHWRVGGSIIGKDLAPNLFQFKFELEQDLQLILSKAPFHFKRWMIILQRWEPVVSDFFPALIPFWITIHGIPLHYWTYVTLKAIGKELGPMEDVEDMNVDRGRIRVLIDGLKPLEMKLDISLPSGTSFIPLR